MFLVKWKVHTINGRGPLFVSVQAEECELSLQESMRSVICKLRTGTVSFWTEVFDCRWIFN